ncbi:four helix bundle protein [Candidatus Gottesmanbacteria bacterium]|nr:four helix bundle protein [Candidatus Gottesmanbacteria bacterium]
MNKAPNSKYDLEDRTRRFAKRCRDYVNKLPRTITNIEYGEQLARSSSSPGANYIEANESLSRKDFVMRIKICRKESKESCYWLSLTQPKTEDENEKEVLIDEGGQLVKIFNAIVEKSL